MDKIFEDIDCVFIYIDDILIFSNDEISHKKDIETVLSILNEHNLKISATKCFQCDFPRFLRLSY